MDEAAIQGGVDLVDKIYQLKQERNAVIFAHYYQDPSIQDLADFLGDSLAMARQAVATSADVIVLCGVVFMAEMAKVLNPDRILLIPDMQAGCSLADDCPADEFRQWVDAHPDHVVVTYVNSSIEVKALSDITCTSSNAERVISSIPLERPILFAPDRNLGRYIQSRTKREMLLWPGSCEVHKEITETGILALKAEHPDALVTAHPECDETVLRHADHIGSTTSMVRYTSTGRPKKYIVATEEGVIHQMRKMAPQNTYLPAVTGQNSDCGRCRHMRLNSLEKVYRALRDLKPQIVLDENIMCRALTPLEKMLAVT